MGRATYLNILYLTEDDDDCNKDTYTNLQEAAVTKKSVEMAYLEWIFFKKFEAVQSFIERLPGINPPMRRSALDSSMDTPSRPI